MLKTVEPSQSATTLVSGPDLRCMSSHLYPKKQIAINDYPVGTSRKKAPLVNGRNHFLERYSNISLRVLRVWTPLLGKKIYKNCASIIVSLRNRRLKGKGIGRKKKGEGRFLNNRQGRLREV